MGQRAQCSYGGLRILWPSLKTQKGGRGVSWIDLTGWSTEMSSRSPIQKRGVPNSQGGKKVAWIKICFCIPYNVQNNATYH